MKYSFFIKGIIVLGLSLPICSKTFSQDLSKSECCDHYDSVTNMFVATFVEQMPVFPGGDNNLMCFFRKNFSYPKNQVNRLQSLISVGFVVDTNGNIRGPRILGKFKKDLTPLDKEGLRIVSLMPKWLSGKCKGKKVPVFMSFQWRIEPQF